MLSRAVTMALKNVYPRQACREAVVWGVVADWAQYGSTSSGGRSSSSGGGSGGNGRDVNSNGSNGSGSAAAAAAGQLCRDASEVERALPLVRFPLMSDAELKEVGGHPMAAESPLLRALLAEATASHAATYGCSEVRCSGLRV